MKLKIKKETLFNSLKNAMAFTNKSHKIPTIANVLFKAEKNKLILTGTDLFTEGKIIVNENIEIFEEGIFLTNTTKLFDIIRLSSLEEIELKADDNKLTITDLDSSYELFLIDYEDFSEFEIKNENFKTIKIKTNKLKKSINETIFAINPLHYRIYLTGINIKLIDNNKIQFTGSDNYRISFSYIYKEDDEIFDTIDIIIPKKTAQHIIRILNSFSEEYIEFQYSEKFFRISTENVIITSKLIDEKYPDTSQILSLEYPYQIKINKEKLIKSLKKALIFHSDTEDYAILEINENQILIYSQDSQYGKSLNKINLKENSPKKFKLALNPKYILDLDPILIGENVIFNLIDNEEKILITDENNPYFKYYLVPYQTEEEGEEE